MYKNTDRLTSEAVTKMTEQLPNKPVTDENGNLIGEVTASMREGTRVTCTIQLTDPPMKMHSVVFNADV